MYIVVVAKICPMSRPRPDPKTANRAVSASAEATYGGLLHRYLVRQLRNRDDASDLAQEAYLRFLQLPDVSAIRDARGYLFRIALHLLSEWRWRRDRGLVTFDSQLVDAKDFREPAADELTLLLGQEALAQVLDQIPHTYRRVLLWNKCDGLTNQQIAERLNVSPETVVRYLAKATALARKARWNESP